MAADDRFTLLRLLLAHYEELTGYLTRRLGSPGAARDVVHDTYLRLQGLETVPELSNPRAYLYRIADNIALDHLRADGRRGQRFVAEELGADRESGEPSAEDVLVQRQRLGRLAAAVDDLPPRQREVFLMHKFDGLGHAEIARRLGISRSMVEKHIMRAMAYCRDRLDP
ncbi:MAG: RNA polymerase subunit sigma-70 [Rhodospirillaceae bacterium]|nr:RNA polymerase subunit sigma-70 [Rhodospirillaceae bacterium]